ncbi:Ribosomal protein S12 methylthiotransferase RimO [Candidatus Protochlamydia naegleriophila]|uniref:Ribosomal protein uS12 methylthiotransferase RimO n=1 Tax=Candidatus Protochlamydia naegleriophila TaxID=389348 RepID=A0A0U5J920_9BACT|nr:30S ribosomal protein S12 methylthiotransferase RimO [Candidatus Protochlamydia naegleriophila]CUI16280.1 Ribosomal protein S12 methylthiotransferase RimO [Candidatus Protochlamydia naegleriophila]
MLPILKNQDSQDRSNQTVPKRDSDESSSPYFNHNGNKINFISLGCPRNLVDSEVMLGILLKAGYEVAPSLEEADYLVINTCGFLEASRQESMDTVQDVLAQRKKTAKLIVTGCMVQTHSDVLKTTFPGIDYLLGSGDVEGILQAVQSTQKGEIVSSARSYLEAGEVPRRLSTPKHFAYLKIAEGCRKRCAYCVIPTIKGPLKSKSKEQILKEFNLLLNQGVKEVILIAQDLGDYGKDQGAKKLTALLDLLQSMLEIKQDFWLRLLYLYPDEITDELIAVMKSDKRICSYLDMPIQHVNNQLLKSMRRMTSKEDIVEIITKLRREVPDVVIRTSLIVGFPGETEEQFEELVQFVQDHPLDNVGIFKFSREPGSHAYDLPNQISDEVKEARYHRLMQVQKKVVKKYLKKMIGKKIPVVVEGYHPETNLLMIGRHMGQCPDIDGQVLINDGRKVKGFGQVYTVEITDVADYDLVGHVL